MEEFVEEEKVKFSASEKALKSTIDKQLDNILKVTRMKVSAIEEIELHRVETVRLAEKARKEQFVTAVMQEKNPEALKLLMKQWQMLDTSVYALGMASESVSKLKLELLSGKQLSKTSKMLK